MDVDLFQENGKVQSSMMQNGLEMPAKCVLTEGLGGSSVEAGLPIMSNPSAHKHS